MNIFQSNKYRLSIAIILLFLFFIIYKKIALYTLAPIKMKDCTFTYPSTTDSTKPTSIVIENPTPLPTFIQKGGVINDASCLNKTSVYGIVKVTTIDDIADAVQFAQNNDLQITSAGTQHSMGGQSFVKNGIVLDMKGFKQLHLNKEEKVLTAESGATWEQIQHFLDTEGLSVKAMQSINIFTVGGTLSVNAHGIAHDPGQVASTIRSMRVMMSTGEIKKLSPTENSELFRLVLGGYGLFGIILDAEIEVVDNEMYEWNTSYMNYRDFDQFYKTQVEGNQNIGLMYGRLSVAPRSFLTETAVHTYAKTDFTDPFPALETSNHNWINRLVINFSKTGAIGKWLRWTLEKYIEPSIHTCITRNQAMSHKEVCLVSRNQEMYDSMGYLKNRLNDTDILQEYFIPHDQMTNFVDGLRDIVKKNHANLLNVTIRIVHQDTITALPYAKEDMYAFVLYFNQKLTKQESAIVEQTTNDLINLATELKGTFYLPYQLYYSKKQLEKAYPEINTFFAAKKKYDPTTLFSNTFYEKYGK
ncbi:MAG: FAD-binding oxidoreductase [Candidatus Magasanikbacteria bacterium]|nr:FAD-binding oxidoreductase [Candidatus Magasanikbacteria bacterium]